MLVLLVELVVVAAVGGTPLCLLCTLDVIVATGRVCTVVSDLEGQQLASDQVALLVGGEVAWEFDNGTTGQVDLVHPASVLVGQLGIDIDGDERAVFKTR